MFNQPTLSQSKPFTYIIPNGVSFTVTIVQNLAMIVPEIALFFDSALMIL